MSWCELLLYEDEEACDNPEQNWCTWKLLLDCETGKQISTNKNKEDNKPTQIKNEKKILWILVRSARHAIHNLQFASYQSMRAQCV